MTLQRDNQTLDPKLEEQHLKRLVSDILAEAKQQGATAAEVGVSLDTGLSASIRKGEVDTVEFNCDRGFGITVYLDKRKGSASTSDSSAKAIKDTVTAALNIAKYTSEDQCSGLADPELMAKDIPDLDLYHPWGVNAEEAIDIAKEAEAAAFAVSNKITNSEGASVSTHQGCRVYGNSHGFIEGYVSSRHSISCVLIAQEKEEMQRDYWYTVNRDAQLLEAAAEVGRKAADRTIKRLGAQKVPTTTAPVLFSAELAGGLLSHLIGAISGSSLYRQSSFLLDHLGKQIFPDYIHIHEQPHITRAIGSAAFDNDGLATYAKDFVKDGILTNYMLGTYSARRLKMQSTANAGGVHNLTIDPTEPTADLLALVKKMDKGLLVTELMGQGVNLVTGDYSRGAAGFWVENGEIQYPVSEITVAGNLKDIFNNIAAVGNDIDYRGNVRTGSILVEAMMVAGH